MNSVVKSPKMKNVCSLYFLQYVVSSPFHSICRKMLSFGFYRSVSIGILLALKLADKTCILFSVRLHILISG